jgi:hypothetical protein
MPRRKGDNPFKPMQTGKIAEKVKLIKGYLALLPKGVKFDKYKDLEKYIVEKIGCAHSTITRQSSYTNIIVAKYADMNPDIDKIDPDNATPAQTKKLIDYYKLESSSLKGDLGRKQKYFESAEYINQWLESNATSEQPHLIPWLSEANIEPKLLSDDSVTPEQTKVLSGDLEKSDGTGNEPSWQQKYEVTCEALFLFITKMEKHWNIKYDRKAGTLLDAPSEMEDEEYIEVYVPDQSAPQANLRYLREFLDKKGR